LGGNRSKDGTWKSHEERKRPQRRETGSFPRRKLSHLWKKKKVKNIITAQRKSSYQDEEKDN